MMIKTVLLLLLLASPAQGEIYRWTDARGTTHYTNSEYEIPSKYRNRAVVLNLGLPAPANPVSPPAMGGVALPEEKPQPEVKIPPPLAAPSPVSPKQRPRRRASRDDD
jgi:hypothetical protein